MKVLLVVDLQREFVKDREGKKRYEAALKYIAEYARNYSYVLASVYKNDSPNMGRLVNWNEMKNIQALDFTPDHVIMHGGYCPSEFPRLSITDSVDVIGLDTDACVLNHCFSLFNLGVNFNVLTDYCWSSGGKAMHEAGLTIMKRQFPKALLR